MRYYLCIDDTDNLETKGTGWLVEQVCTEMTDLGLGCFSPISRHQLYVHEDVPYTSHNSSMCVTVSDCPSPDAIISHVQRFLEEKAAPGSDPGLCLVPDTIAPEAGEKLMRFGEDAKCTVLNKTLAYELAGDIRVHLSEHGGTGDGVVGALAGVGLRMRGNDGRYRGWHHLGPEDTPMEAGEIARLCEAHHVEDESGVPVSSDTPILLRDRIKRIRRKGQVVLLASRATQDGPLQLLHKMDIKKY